MSMRPAPRAVAPARASRALYGPSRIDQLLEVGTADIFGRKTVKAPPPQPKPPPPHEVRPHVKTISTAKLEDIQYLFQALDAEYRGWSGVFFKMTEAKYMYDPAKYTHEFGYVKIYPRTMDPDAKLAKMIKSDNGSFFKHFREQYRLTIEEQQRNGDNSALNAWSSMSGIDGKRIANKDHDFKAALQLCAGGDLSFNPFQMHPIQDWREMLLEFYTKP